MAFVSDAGSTSQHLGRLKLTLSSGPAPVGWPGVRLERLYPDRGTTTPDEVISGLDLAANAPDDRPYLVMNMVSTLDGKATIEWRTRGLSSDVDRECFQQLRTQTDAVMVG